MDCLVCRKLHSHPMQGPFRSPLADDSKSDILPWTSVIIDCQGPFTKAEGGEQYVLSYMCTRLKVPFLESMVSLQSGHFSRALMKCVFRSRCIPDVVASDRGPEMANKITEEFLALCGTKHIMGAALTPRHQGLSERSHQVMMTDMFVLMEAICTIFPQEWTDFGCGIPLAYLPAGTAWYFG